VGERQVEVDDLVFGDLANLGDHVDDRAVVAVREHAALRRPGSARGIDEREGILRADRGAARLELLGRAPASPLTDLLECDRAERLHSGGGRAVGLATRGVDHDDRAEIRQPIADLCDLRELLLVLADHRAGLGV
jgi:hypothetical protein